MKVLLTTVTLTLLSLLSWVETARADLGAPEIVSASFDSQGRLRVKSKHSGYQGCYLGVYGGLKATKVDTLIISRQLGEKEVTAGKVTFSTKRRYYCKRRTLYVSVELVCLGDEVGQFTSAVKSVAVPTSNIRR